ncbi:MAG: endonuclease/exonuclease/phosphatase family protein [Candidatus Electrothrix sp. AR3]|nr:endonuclease/exonuclease/phosphatase family protein [Candidatus Electrothrix sp. AR3]
MRGQKRYILNLFIIFLSVSLIASCSPKIIPEPHQVLLERGSGSSSALKGPIHILVWNIAKGKKNRFVDDFKQVSKNKDVVLLQEFHQNDQIDQALFQNTSFFYSIATSFIYDKDNSPTGVATGSTVQPAGSSFQITKHLEPFVKTPKATLLTEYPLADSQHKLLVVNIHGMNRAGFEAFEEQLDRIRLKIENHLGPILFGGDFNTNSKEKREYLYKLINKIGLSEVVFRPDTRTVSGLSRIPLDYIFTKGLNVRDARVMEELEGSDHNALLVVVDLE